VDGAEATVSRCFAAAAATFSSAAITLFNSPLLGLASGAAAGAAAFGAGAGAFAAASALGAGAGLEAGVAALAAGACCGAGALAGWPAAAGGATRASSARSERTSRRRRRSFRPLLIQVTMIQISASGAQSPATIMACSLGSRLMRFSRPAYLSM